MWRVHSCAAAMLSASPSPVPSVARSKFAAPEASLSVSLSLCLCLLFFPCLCVCVVLSDSASELLQSMEVVVPRGTAPGDVVSAQAPSGRVVMVRIPAVAAAVPGVTIVAAVSSVCRSLCLSVSRLLSVSLGRSLRTTMGSAW